MQRIDRERPTAIGMRFQRGTFNTKSTNTMARPRGLFKARPISTGRTLQVVRVYHDDTDGLPVLVVEDLSERAAAPSSDVS
jgi:hypothetical protein